MDPVYQYCQMQPSVLITYYVNKVDLFPAFVDVQRVSKNAKRIEFPILFLTQGTERNCYLTSYDLMDEDKGNHNLGEKVNQS